MEAIFIDVDGTLVDSYPGVVASYEAALAAVGKSHPEHLSRRAILGPPMVESLAKAGVTEEEMPAARAAYFEAYGTHGWDNCSAYPGVLELLQWLRAEGLRVATATSKGEFYAHKVLDHLGLLPYIEFLGTAGEMGVDRPTKAAVVGYVIEQTGWQDSIMLGDRIHDIEGAAAHGLRTIAAGWGYGTAREWDQAAFVAATPADVQRIVNGLR